MDDKILRKVEDVNTKYAFWCPACKCAHFFQTTGYPDWKLTGSMLNPTITPSIRVQGYSEVLQKNYVCHSVITGGIIEYMGDCTHELAGKEIQMEAF
jgi:hypothetical protein